MNSPTVLLVADPPPPVHVPAHDGPFRRRGTTDSPAGRHEALLALARAVFAAHGRLVVPADQDVAPLIGTVALAYGNPPAAEAWSEHAWAPLVVMETEPGGTGARELLTPLARRGALEYLDHDGRTVRLGFVSEDSRRLDDEGGRRQRVTSHMIEMTRPIRAVFISPRSDTTADLEVVRQHKIPVTVFRRTFLEPNVTGPLAAQEDPTERVLSRFDEGREPSSSDGEAETRRSTPYTFLMQRLVAEWFGGRAYRPWGG